MKRYVGISFACLCSMLLIAGAAWAKPVQELQEYAPAKTEVDMVGDVDGTLPAPQKVLQDTVWIADWTYDEGGCNETGWYEFDNRIPNNGIAYWDITTDYNLTGGIVNNAAACRDHNLCWDDVDGYCNGWHQGIVHTYQGDGYLSFDYLVDSEGGYDFIQVEADSACSSFDQVDYNVDPSGNAASFRDILHSNSGYVPGVFVDSLPVSGYGTLETHCLYITFTSDGGWSPCDGLVPSAIGAGCVVDNIVMAGFVDPPLLETEDWETAPYTWTHTQGNNPMSGDIQDVEPFGEWARLYEHITDNDVCTENPTDRKSVV